MSMSSNLMAHDMSIVECSWKIDASFRSHKDIGRCVAGFANRLLILCGDGCDNLQVTFQSHFQ